MMSSDYIYVFFYLSAFWSFVSALLIFIGLIRGEELPFRFKNGFGNFFSIYDYRWTFEYLVEKWKSISGAIIVTVYLGTISFLGLMIVFGIAFLVGVKK